MSTSTTETRTTNVAESIDHQAAVTAERVAAAAEAMTKASGSSIDSQWSYLTEYGDAVAERDNWATVLHVAGNFAGSRPDGNAEAPTAADKVDALRAVVAQVTEGLISNRFGQNSTNPMSNAAAAHKQQAAARFVSEANGRLAYIDKEVSA